MQLIPIRKSNSERTSTAWLCRKSGSAALFNARRTAGAVISENLAR